MSVFYYPNILIIDDNEWFATLLSKQLLDLKFSVEIASCGIIAMEKIKVKRFNLIILDLKMPSMNGDEVLKRIKIFNSSIPVIMMSRNTNVKELEKCISLGADDYFTKPFAFDNLLEKIINILTRSL